MSSWGAKRPFRPRIKRHRSQSQRKLNVSVDSCSPFASLMPLLGTRKVRIVAKGHGNAILTALRASEWHGLAVPFSRPTFLGLRKLPPPRNSHYDWISGAFCSRSLKSSSAYYLQVNKVISSFRSLRSLIALAQSACFELIYLFTSSLIYFLIITYFSNLRKGYYFTKLSCTKRPVEKSVFC